MVLNSKDPRLHVLALRRFFYCEDLSNRSVSDRLINLSSINLLSYFSRQYCTSASEFVAVRGILMVLAMKVSSLAFDKCDSAQIADLISFFAYLFNPATLIFGPFHTFHEFETTLNRRTVKVRLFLGCTVQAT